MNRGAVGHRPASSPDPVKWLLATLRGRNRHHRSDLREDRADAGRDTRHNRARGHGYEAGHQSVFNEILTTSVLDRLQFQKKILHVVSDFSFLVFATHLRRLSKVIIPPGFRKSALERRADSEITFR